MGAGQGAGFVDIHHHLLPGLDDGPEGWDQSLAMARAAHQAGIRVVVATPHVHPGRPGQPGREVIAGLVDELRARLASAGWGDLEVLPGAEVYPVPDLPRWLSKDGRAWDLGQGARVRYLLVDLPFDQLPPHFDRLLFEVMLAGVVPVIAHPERNRQLAAHPDQLAALVERGAVAQVTAASLLGGFGRAAQQAALWFIRHGLARVVATDAHDPVHRSPQAMQQAYRYLSQHLGPELAEMLCVRWPLEIARGEPLSDAGSSDLAASSPGPGGASRSGGLIRGLRAWWERVAGSR